MSKLGESRKKFAGAECPAKYAEQFKNLSEMGFDSLSILDALESTNGNLESATVFLLGESSPIPTRNIPPATATVKEPIKIVRKPVAVAAKPVQAKVQDMKETHNKFMATYKVQKCKEKGNHDKRTCIYWHTKSDRRRNPFEILYSCTECPVYTEAVSCEDGDNCLKAHNMLERMFHPELFKISMCQRGPNGSHCERGGFCAFAHSEEDHRIPLSQQLKLAAANAANAASDALQPSKAMSDSRLLDGIQEKLIMLIRSQGTDGIISSELPKRYYDVYSERLELTDEAGEKFRIKDLLLQQGNISVVMHKGVQPKYVFDATKPSNLLNDNVATTAAVTTTVGNTAVPQTVSVSSGAVGTAVAASVATTTPLNSQSKLANTTTVELATPVAATGTSSSGDATGVKAGRRRGPSAPVLLESSVPEPMVDLGLSVAVAKESVNLPAVVSNSLATTPMPAFGGLSDNSSQSMFSQSPSSPSLGSFPPGMGSIGGNSLHLGSSGMDSLFQGYGGGGGMGSLFEPSGSLGLNSNTSLDLDFDSLTGFPRSNMLGFSSFSGGLGSSLDRNVSNGFLGSMNPSSSSSGNVGGGSSLIGGSMGVVGSRRRGPSVPLSGLDGLHSNSDFILSGSGSGSPPSHSLSSLVGGGDSTLCSDMLLGSGGNNIAIMEMSDKLNAANATCISLRSQIETLQNDAQLKQEESENLSKQLQSATARLQQSEQAKSANAAQWAEIHKELSNSKEKLRLKDEELFTVKETLKDREAALTKAEMTRNSLIPELKQLRGKVATMESDLNHSKEKISEQDKSKSKLSREVEELKVEIASLRSNKSHEEANQNLKTQLQKVMKDLAQSQRERDFFYDQASKANNELKAMVEIEQELRKLSLDAVASKAAMQAEIEALRVQIKESVKVTRSELTNMMVASTRESSSSATAGGSVSFNSNNNNNLRNNSNSIATSSSSSVSASSNSTVSNNSTHKPNPLSAATSVDSTESEFDGPSMCCLPGCTQEGPYICSRCGKTGYCGIEHQKDHWKVHRKECVGKKTSTENK